MCPKVKEEVGKQKFKREERIYLLIYGLMAFVSYLTF